MIWIVVTESRLLLLLVITCTYLPQKVIEFIVGGKIFSFNFSFLSIEKLSEIKDKVQSMDFSQNDDRLKTMGLESGSTIVNNLNLLLVISLIAMTHVL